MGAHNSAGWRLSTPAFYGQAVGPFLIGLGVVLFLLALGLAFTIYGEISAVLGVACVAAGIVKTVRRSSRGPS